jgi:hypothetical protein
VDRLKRAIGRAMIVASSDSQVALEGYKGHGVFYGPCSSRSRTES